MINKRQRVSLPFNTISQLTNAWSNTILNIESGSIIHATLRDQLYRVPEFVKNFSRNYKKYPAKFTSINIPTLAVDDPVELESHLNKISITQNKQLVLIVMGTDLWLEKPEMIAVLDQFAHSPERKTSVLYFMRQDIRNPAIAKRLSQFSSLYQNIHVYPYFKPLEVKHFLNYYGDKFKVSLPGEILDEIINKCGGSLWLAKAALRHYKTHGINDLLTHQEMKLKIKTLYEEMSPEEQGIINNISSGDNKLTNFSEWALNLMMETNLIIKRGRKYKCTIPLLIKYAALKMLAYLHFVIKKDGSLIINDLRVNDLFTNRELELLKLLVKKQNRIVPRSEVAVTLWHTDTADYNDWSLDMAINRLRTKLSKLGIHRKILKTIKNKGYVFQASI